MTFETAPAQTVRKMRGARTTPLIPKRKKMLGDDLAPTGEKNVTAEAHSQPEEPPLTPIPAEIRIRHYGYIPEVLVVDAVRCNRHLAEACLA